MVEKLEIKNFQSHENTILDFHPGVNVITGKSNTGKSSIFRILDWIINNRINNKLFKLSYVSHWNINEKDDIFNPVIGKVIINNSKVERKKENNFNGYKINGKEYKAIGSDIPDEVRKILNFSEVNIQRQFDIPFLSKSSGEIARFFNSIIKIDDIDKVLQLVESKKRKTKSDLNYIEEELRQTSEDLKKLEWVDKANSLINKLSRITKSIDRKELVLIELNDLYYKKLKIEKRIKNYKILKRAKSYFDKINDINESINDETKIIENLTDFIYEYNKLKKQIDSNEEKINKLKDQLPICPYCNQIIEGETL
jgi:exonuclease SbcC